MIWSGGRPCSAADLDPQVRLKRRRPHGGIAQRVERLVTAADLFPGAVTAAQADGQLLAAAGPRRLDQLRRLLQLAGADDQIDIRGSFEDLPLVLLSHAAQHANDFLGISLLVPPQVAQGAVDLVFGVLPHAARVEQDRVRLVDRVHQLIAVLPEAGHHHFAVQHIHLAADGFDVDIVRHDCQSGFSRTRAGQTPPRQLLHDSASAR